uniref:Zinc finger CCCH domain-containing protein 14 n=1 Tax=Saccoglossus kowalevskii TaxID=10224 RepID=A0ABM0GYW2_SACKO|nr:PREDICTED: zinc finger CCCH domain-containing protein 14-like [Saccoglossus kowalevskii]
MEIGTEISHKIRLAIKNKLVDLGAYVDDELPDYIMVMIANKKSQQQMTDDLSLFLGNNTDKFTDWLHGVLHKLQTATLESSTKQQNMVLEDSLTQEEVLVPQIEPAKPEHQPRQHETAVEPKVTDKLPSPEPVSMSEPQEAIISLKPETDDLMDEELKFESSPIPVVMTEHKQKATVPPTQPRYMATASTRVSSATTTPAVSEAKFVSKVQPVARKRRAPGSVIGQVLSHDFEDDDDDVKHMKAGSVASVVRISERRTSLPPSKQANRALVLKAVNEAHDSTSMIARRQRPSNLSSRQANKNILMKAIGDAQESISHRRPVTGKLIQIVRRVEPSSTATSTAAAESIGHVSRTYIHEKEQRVATAPYLEEENLQIEELEVEESISDKEAIEQKDHVRFYVIKKQDTPPVMSRTIAREYAIPSRNVSSSSPYNMDVVTRPIRHGDQRIIQQADHGDDNVDDGDYDDADSINSAEEQVEVVLPIPQPPPQHQFDVKRVRTDSFESTRVVQPVERPRTVSPKFIVTLDGVNPPSTRKKRLTRKKRTRPTLMIQPNVANRPAPDNTFDDEGVGDELDEDEDYEDEQEDEEDDYMEEAPVQQQMVQPIVIHKVMPTQDEEMPSERSPPKKSKMVERCKFWPTCKSGSACPYHHPNVPCKAFPKCRYEDKCRYIHPNCKYDARCNKTDCPFTHASKRMYPPLYSPKQPPPAPPPSPVIRPAGIHYPLTVSLPPHQVLCRFFPENCKKMDCPYLHPKTCRYGLKCTRPDCKYHHPKITMGDALKWVKPSANRSTSSR